VFNECCFLLGKGGSVIIAIPAMLPEASTYTVAVTNKNIRFKADYNALAEMPYPGGEIYRRLAKAVQVGLVEYDPESGRPIPDSITNLAYIEIRSVM
jgi:hypothetical protein